MSMQRATTRHHRSPSAIARAPASYSAEAGSRASCVRPGPPKRPPSSLTLPRISSRLSMQHENHGTDVHLHHGAGDGGDGDDCVFFHAISFHAGVCQEILFPGWNTRNAWQVAGSALLFLVAGILYEGLKYYREALHRAAAPAPTRSTDSHLDIAKNECGPSAPCAQTAVVRYSMWSQDHVIQTLLHILQATASYLLMLVFMTYNVWLCAGLVLGLGIGYFLFGWKKHTVVDLAEHCQ